MQHSARSTFALVALALCAYALAGCATGGDMDPGRRRDSGAGGDLDAGAPPEDAGADPVDAGDLDAGADAGSVAIDAGIDAGPVSCAGSPSVSCEPAAGNECCVGACEAGACVTSVGTCADACGANVLATGRGCAGCGPARAAGTCAGGAMRRCDDAVHTACEQATCGGATYYCTFQDGSWAWRASPGCDDGNACTHGDACSAGTCGGTPVTCTSDTCATRVCNGTATCTVTPNAGASCDDGDPCSFGETCSAAGTCTATSRVTCTSTPCITRACNGTATCSETIRIGSSCDDGNACSYGDTCSASGVCASTGTLSCDGMDTTCRDFSCDGTATCASAPRTGATCDDGDPATSADVCQADGTCRGSTCSGTLAIAFSEDFASPSSTTWSTGTAAALSSTRWRIFTSAQHGVRAYNGRLEITNDRGSSSPGHGHGYAYVRTGGTGSVYDNGVYDATLSGNAGSEVVWSFNMRRDGTTTGGFRCSSTSSQNDITVGLAYVLATDDPFGLNASTSTCSSSGAARGYAVVLGGNRRLRLVRFEGGLRNGTLTDIVASGDFTISNYFSVRVTYDARTNAWRLEARSDGSSSFSDPASGTYSFNGTGTDATFTTIPLEYSGPYFQTGCTGLCEDVYLTRFDNVRVGVRCAP